MKLFGKIIALAFVLFNTACKPDEPPPPPPPPGDWKTVSINANLAPEIRNYNDGVMFLSWRGTATSSLVGEINLSLSHLAYDFDKNENFDIQEGSFKLWSEDQQHILEGTYTGHGFMTNGQFVMQGYMKVQLGTGKFVYEKASLSFSIGKTMPFSDLVVESEISIRGKLKIPDNEPEL